MSKNIFMEASFRLLTQRDKIIEKNNARPGSLANQANTAHQQSSQCIRSCHFTQMNESKFLARFCVRIANFDSIYTCFRDCQRNMGQMQLFSHHKQYAKSSKTPTSKRRSKTAKVAKKSSLLTLEIASHTTRRDIEGKQIHSTVIS